MRFWSYLSPYSQGLIDFEKEIARLNDKKAKLEAKTTKLNEKMSRPNYETHAPQDVKEKDLETVGWLSYFIQNLSVW